MNALGHPLVVLLFAPVLLVVVAAQAFWSIWTAGVVPVAASTELAVWVERHCPVDALVVLGAAQYDGLPSAVLEGRLAGALRLFEAGCAPTIVVSGGGREGDRTTEGATGVAWLSRQGIPTDALIAETRARTTVENLRFSAEVAPVGRWLIVTDDLHTVRAGYAAQRLGLDAGVAGVRTRGDRLAYAYREMTAIVAYRLGAFR